jgi:hypothetical protein
MLLLLVDEESDDGGEEKKEEVVREFSLERNLGVCMSCEKGINDNIVCHVCM